jgi:hypothetical protein
MDTSSQPRRTAEGGGGTRPSIASQNGPSRVTYLFYQSIPVLRDLLHRESLGESRGPEDFRSAGQRNVDALQEGCGLLRAS